MGQEISAMVAVPVELRLEMQLPLPKPEGSPLIINSG